MSSDEKPPEKKSDEKATLEIENLDGSSTKEDIFLDDSWLIAGCGTGKNFGGTWKKPTGIAGDGSGSGNSSDT